MLTFRANDYLALRALLGEAAAGLNGFQLETLAAILAA